jgi:intracellular multiplication protein IcmL
MQTTAKVETENNTKSPGVAYFKDDFYRDGFRYVMLSLAMVVGAIGLLIVVSLYFFLHQVLPITFPVYADWRVQTDVPVDRPYLHTPDLLQWVSHTLPIVTAMDFVNYNTELKAMPPYFTANGWAKYLDFLKTYMSYDDMSKKKEFVAGVPSGAPVVLNQGVIDGKYGWWVQMPLDVRYSGIEGDNREVKVNIQALVIRVPTLNNLDGVAIENLIVTKVQG